MLLEKIRSHNPEVVGSSPASATRKEKPFQSERLFSFIRLVKQVLIDLRVTGGERADRRQWRMQGGERVAAVYIFKAALTAAENIGHRNRA